jgi:chromosomal replication initiation ATPase DnaA
MARILSSDLWEGYKATEILDAVADAYRMSAKRILSRERTQRTARARQVVMFLLREKLKWSFPVIGEFMNRDHSTAIHGYNLLRKSISEFEIESIRKKLRAQVLPVVVMPETQSAEFYFEATA